MKKLLLISFILGFIVNVAHAQNYGWIKVMTDSISGTPHFSDLYFTDDNTGWITSSSLGSNNVFKTTDGGSTFTIQTTTRTLEAIQMVSATDGYCGGGSGTIFRTTTGGNTWSISGTIANTLTDISFPPGCATGYACGLNGAVWSITSGGVTNLNSGLANTFNGISSPSVNNVWICGSSYIYYYNGSNFTEQSSPSGTFNAIYFINNLEGWVVGDRGIIAHTINGGGSWTVQRIPGSGSSLFDVFFLNSNEGWAVGVNGTILHTTNGGTSWNTEAAGLTTAFLRGVQFTSPTNGYIVGNNKALLKYTQFSAISENIRKDGFSVFPNPTNGKIKVQIPDDHRFEYVCISDRMGGQVIRIDKPASREIDLGSLPSGMYLIQIVTNNSSFSKMIVKQ